MVRDNPRKKLRTTYTLIDERCLECVIGWSNINALEVELSATFSILIRILVLLEYVLKKPSCLFERDVVLYIRYNRGGQFNGVSRLENAEVPSFQSANS